MATSSSCVGVFHTFAFDLTHPAHGAQIVTFTIYKIEREGKVHISASYSNLLWGEHKDMLAVCLSLTNREWVQPKIVIQNMATKQRFLQMAAFVGDRDLFDKVAEWVGVFNIDTLQEFIEKHKCTVLLRRPVHAPTPVQHTNPNTHAFSFRALDGTETTTITLIRIKDEVFVKSIDCADMSKKSHANIRMCMQILGDASSIASARCSLPENILSWLQLAVYTGNINTYKLVSKWCESGTTYNSQLLAFAQECHIDTMIKYFTPVCFTTTIDTNHTYWEIRVRCTYVCEMFEFDTTIVGTLPEKELTHVHASIELIKKLPSGVMPSVDELCKQSPVTRAGFDKLQAWVVKCRK